MSTSYSARITALFAVGLMTAACAEGTTTVETTPEIQSRQLAQLSAGGGIASYDFMVGETKVGALLVTEAIFDANNGALDATLGRYCSDGICNQMEYWRWDEDSLGTIQAGLSGAISVTVNGTSETYSASIVTAFEADTDDFRTWDVNRLFDFSDASTFQFNSPPLGTVLFTVEATPWEGFEENVSVTYYLKMQFDLGSVEQSIPEMTWYLDYGDYETWLADSDYSASTADEIYEVRLNNDSELSQTVYGLGYELKTLSL